MAFPSLTRGRFQLDDLRLVPVLTIPHIAEEGEEEEGTGQYVRPSHHPGHRLRVDGVRREQESRDCRRHATSQEELGDVCEHGSNDGMEEDVTEVVAERVELPEEVVESEGEDSERSVGLVRAAVGEGSSPKVIVKELSERSPGK